VRYEVIGASGERRSGELADAATDILISAFELDFHGDPDSDSRFTIIPLSEPVLIKAAREAARTRCEGKTRYSSSAHSLSARWIHAAANLPASTPSSGAPPAAPASCCCHGPNEEETSLRR